MFSVLSYAVVSCTEERWRCHDGRRSIGLEYVCDGKLHCTGGSDEQQEVCASWQCASRMWKCWNNKCIDETKVCDGNYFDDGNCMNVGDESRSDEKPEVCALWQCPAGYFKCECNQCISEDLVCDGRANCKSDASDEDDELCARWACPADRWK